MDAFICDYIRTPIGRFGGALAHVRTDDLAAIPVKSLVERNRSVDWAALDEVFLGCANQAGEDNRNVARMAVLLAGLPIEVPAQTINRLCGSGLQAVNSASHAIMVGDGDVMVAGGVESMTRAPIVQLKAESAFQRGTPQIADSTLGWRFVNPRLEAMYPAIPLGETAELVAERWGVSREDQDAFALLSQQRAAAAIASGRFNDQLVPVTIPQRGAAPIVVDRDEHPRADTTAEGLANLSALFVSRKHRRKGIASLLTEEVSRLARADCARRLYVSATPSRPTVEFYRSHKFKPTDEPNEKLFALEPDDIHMILEL